MMDLDDPRWSSLSSTYTSGAVVATLLRKLESGTLSGEEEEDFWQELCHQHDSTEAGYAAVPHLIRLAQGRALDKQLEYLSFAAHILSCGQRERSDLIPEYMLSNLAAAQQAGLAATLALLARGPWKPGEVRYLLATVASFLGRHELYFLLEGADCGFECPGCHATIYPLDDQEDLPGL